LKTLPENLEQPTNEEQTTGLKDLQAALEVAQALVPSPTRKASLRSLDKIRLASTALMHYFMIKGGRIANVPPQTMKKIQGVMSESIMFVLNALMDENEGTHDGKDSEDALTLQHAWMK
jgi:hypothetical protein